MAQLDKRDNIGSDIYIHGKDVSIGCVAVGDEAIEELFVLAKLTNISNVKVIIVPCDFSEKDKLLQIYKNSPEWTRKLYHNIQENSPVNL